jgi:tRNA dimethylallyltransferase
VTRAKTPGDDLHTGVRLVVVTGATAAGKTRLSLSLAREFGAEIVNGDAMQAYRGLDIGTAKPSADQRGEVPHHLFDLWRVSEAASVAVYQTAARSAMMRIWARRRPVVVVGGSPLYLRAACDELQIPPSDPRLREQLQQRADREGSSVLHRELSESAPDAAAAIDPRNVRRVVRALEVVRLTGSFTARMPAPVPWRPAVWLGVGAERAVLDERIAERAEAMWTGGLLAEVEGLLREGLAEGPTARRAVGYTEAIEVLAGRMSEAEGLEATIRTTRRLARRQQRAFRADARIHPVDGPDDLDTALAVLARAGLRPP